MKEELNLRQKLAKIRDCCDVVTKEKKGYGYTYTDITTILAKISTMMKKLGVSLEPQIVSGTTSVTFQPIVKTKVDKAGNVYDDKSYEYVVSADMIYKWIDDATGEEISVPWTMMGSQSDPSQSFGSGMSYCTRYFLTKYFQIAEVDTDVDAYRSKQKEAEAAEETEIASKIIEAIDEKVLTLLGESKDNDKTKEELRKFFLKYTKDGNYKKVKESKLAGKMLSDFENTFLKG